MAAPTSSVERTIRRTVSAPRAVASSARGDPAHHSRRLPATSAAPRTRPPWFWARLRASDHAVAHFLNRELPARPRGPGQRIDVAHLTLEDLRLALQLRYRGCVDVAPLQGGAHHDERVSER